MRDLFTTSSEQESIYNKNSDRIGCNFYLIIIIVIIITIIILLLKKGDWTLSSECAHVDVVVNTIGFPLVGGPAGY